MPKAQSRKPRAWSLLFSPHFLYQIHHHRQYDAQHDAGDDRKINGGAFSAIDDVAGQAPDRQPSLPKKYQDDADDDDGSAEVDQDFSKIAHGESLRPPLLGCDFSAEKLRHEIRDIT